MAAYYKKNFLLIDCHDQSHIKSSDLDMAPHLSLVNH